jgi:hypothetical protein
MKIPIGNLTFDVPDEFRTQQLDETTFYTDHFQGIISGEKSQDKKQGVKAVDLVVFHPQKDELWLLEVKDYRANPRIKRIDIFDEFAIKVVHSLACLAAMQINANVPEEQQFAHQALRKIRLRAVLHLEQAIKPSKHFPQVIDPKTALRKIRTRLKAIDTKALVSSIEILGTVPWRVK